IQRQFVRDDEARLGPTGDDQVAQLAVVQLHVAHAQASSSADPWTVTVDGQPQEYPSLYRLTWPERVRMLALTVHRAER
ncbi:hypothetical protein, partial [Actinacidiphila soli]|uniref:hypothetical protein n=1 Tax=Actinacidiphila soli TaxID=2487275 RepID=UPI0019D12C8D